jgi:hypothetical protein
MKFGYAVFGLTAVVQAQASTYSDQARIGAHDLVPFSYGKAGNGAGWGMPHRRSILECSALNAQLYLRAGSEFTPDRQFRSDLFLASPVPGTSAVFNHAWVNALSIVAKA